MCGTHTSITFFKDYQFIFFKHSAPLTENLFHPFYHQLTLAGY